MILSDFEKRYTRMYILQICRFVANVIVGILRMLRKKGLQSEISKKDRLQAAYSKSD